jgi:carboxyl-terminal processing protease
VRTRFAIVVTTIILTAILGYGGLCAAGNGPGRGAAPAVTGAWPQESALLAARSNRTAREQANRDVETPLFKAVVQLVRDQYVHEINAETIFENPVHKLLLTLPPLCLENLPNVMQCSAEADECLLEAVKAVAVHCHLSSEFVFRTVLNFILKDLDPNSCLLDQDMLKELAISTSGKFGGVGMMVAPRNGDYVVISPFEGSPARKAGIRPGDIMLEIDGRPIHDLPLMEVLRQVRGPVGSVMSVTVKSGQSGVIRHVNLRRKTIIIPPVRYTVLGDEIGYVRIVNFQASTSAELEKALERIKARCKGSLQGLILDLRDNPGGLLDQAIHAARLFVSSGTITSLRGRNQKLNREFIAERSAVMTGVPVIVLINRGSASASEILAGALQGQPHILILGERSFGKASVQAVYPLGGGTALRLTTAHYYTAQGRDIEGKGLEPDVTMDEPSEHLETEKIDALNPQQLLEDPWIQRSLEYVRAGGASPGGPFPSLY